MVVLVCRVVGGGDGRGVALDAAFLWVMFRAGKEDTQGRLHVRATVDSGGFGGVSDVEWTWEERSAFQQDRGDKYLRQLPAHHPLLHRIHPCRFPSWKLLDTPPNPLLSRQKVKKMLMHTNVYAPKPWWHVDHVVMEWGAPGYRSMCQRGPRGRGPEGQGQLRSSRTLGEPLGQRNNTALEWCLDCNWRAYAAFLETCC